MRKILIITAVFPPEPVVSANLSLDIANVLSEKNNVIVISPQPSRPFGFKFSSLSFFNFNHIVANSFTCSSSSLVGRFKESLSFGKYCYKYISDNYQTLDVIYANTWPIIGQYCAVKAAFKYNIPILLHVQDIYPESLTNKLPILKPLINFLLLPIDNYILRNATKIIAISEKMKDYLATTRNISQKKIVVIKNWQDEAAFVNFNSSTKQIFDRNKPFTYMYMGNIGPVAGIDLVLEAFSKAELINSRLVIAGDGSLKEVFQRRVEEMKLTTVEFWSVPLGKVPEVQYLADVMLLPVKKGAALSSIPSKLPAYMFSQKPILACVDKNSDTANTIISSKCGWISAPDDIYNLILTMKSIRALSKEELQKRGENGFNFAIEHFSKQKNLSKIICTINETLNV